MGNYEEGEVGRFKSAKFIDLRQKKGPQDQFVRDLGARLE